MEFGKRLRSRIWRGSVDEEVDAEFEFHVEMRVRELVAGGMEPSAARQTAIKRFGDINRVNATCRRIGRGRDKRHAPHRVSLRAHARHPVCRSPIAAQPGIHDRGRRHAGARHRRHSRHFQRGARRCFAPDSSSPPGTNHRCLRGAPRQPKQRERGQLRGRRAACQRVQSRHRDPVLQLQSRRRRGYRARDRRAHDRRVLRRFATAPSHGRVFTTKEDRPGQEQVVVLSHRLWTRRFAGNPSIVGKTLRLNGRQYEVIGVMPPHFDFTARTEELWVPIAFTAERKATHDEHYLQTYGRLKPNATMQQALGELVRNAADLKVKFPLDNAELGFQGGRRRWMSSWEITVAVSSSCWEPSGSCSSSRAATSPICCWREAPRARASWRCEPRSAPDADASCVNCSPRVPYWLSLPELPDWRSPGGECACSSPPLRPACLVSNKRP